MRQTSVQAIGTANPGNRASQHTVAEFMKRAARASVSDDPTADPDRTDRIIDRIYRGSAIKSRSSVVPDYTREPEAFAFYPPNWALEPVPSTAARMEVYRREAPPLAREAVERCLAGAPDVPREAVSHLVVVSCTGLFAPGLDILLVKELGLRRDVQRQVIGFMGCYAAFNGLRAAHAICRTEPEAVVLVVCVELCSLHFQRELTMDNIVANCLFADGAAAALLTSEPEGSRRGRLSIVDSYSLLEGDSLDQMTWTVTDTGFQMSLAAEIPTTLRHNVEPFVETLLGRNGLRRGEVGFWAIHPGGRKIVEAIEKRLELPPSASAPAYEVLAEHGNMSSATILFVLERCLERRPPAGALGVAMAFGPGLTLESMLLRAL